MTEDASTRTRICRALAEWVLEETTGWAREDLADGYLKAQRALEDILAMVDLTRDSLDRYDGSGWAEAEGESETQIPDGLGGMVPARSWERVQAKKGDERVTLYVADFGAYRAVWQL